MEIQIIERKENSLLSREELKIQITHDAAPIPSRDKLVRKLSAELNKEKEQIIVREMDGQFGAARTIATVMVYETTVLAREIERPHVINRHKFDEENSESA